MSAKNLADARLALHQRVASVLVDLFAGGEDFTEEDVETAEDIVDELFSALSLEVVGVDEGRIVVGIPL